MTLPIFSIVFSNFSKSFHLLIQSIKHFWFILIPVMITAHFTWFEIIRFSFHNKYMAGFPYGHMFNNLPGYMYNSLPSYMHNNIPDSMFYHHGLHMFAGHLLFTILFLIISSFLLMWVAVVWMEKTITHSTPDIRFDSRFVTAMLIDILLGLIIIIPISGLILMGGSLDSGGTFGGIINILTVIAIIAWLIFCIRFIVIFPAIAVNKHTFRFKAALALTKGNTIQLFTGYLLTIGVFVLIGIGLGYIIIQLPMNAGGYMMSLFLISVFVLYYVVHISEFISMVYMWLINMEIA